ncbi:hypothetical protein CDD82_5672 [Ophiocordyceps australis]|uniref:Inner centromere protein ARK-binding domain-containing protein n=1 Tax=Ophiocordyceps australis TaxID=1399860 RepID=A0A2C5Z1K6_9HYPO|nr:hypothetical protein CDD82_5672 [Ophiocordyceps australis]
MPSHHVPAEALEEPQNAIFDTLSASEKALETAPLLSGLQQGNTQNDVGSSTSPFAGQSLTRQGIDIPDSDSKPCQAMEHQALNDSHSPSDGSSPIRPVVRKSSLNFASLPAREPLTAGKSFGAQVSRTSHIDHTRTSHYNRQTGGKSLGNVAKSESEDDFETADMRLHHESRGGDSSKTCISHAKTYTQRLQDHISKLGKSDETVATDFESSQPHQSLDQKSLSPAKKGKLQTTPGAFPNEENEDDCSDWDELPASNNTVAQQTLLLDPSGGTTLDSQNKAIAITHDSVRDGDQVSAGAEVFPKANKHHKSPSVSTLPALGSITHPDLSTLEKSASASCSDLRLTSAADRVASPSKSSLRDVRESPLRQVKNKLSSMLKSSRGLLASSAAASAEGKLLLVSPSSAPSGFDSAIAVEPEVPLAAALGPQQNTDEGSPRSVARRRRASTEREKEEKRREKEAKLILDQNAKLQKAREKEREKAIAFSKEHEQRVTREKYTASEEKKADLPICMETSKVIESNSQKNSDIVKCDSKEGTNDDIEMQDAPAPSARSVGPCQSTRAAEIKRPVKPAKETQSKTKQAPTLIRVNMGSQQSQYQGANRSSFAQETPGYSNSQSQQSLAARTSKASLHGKPAVQSLRGAPPNARTKALDLAARKRDQEEREAQRRRDVKTEMDRKRAALQEEQRKQDTLQRQTKHGRESATSQTEAKRKAAVEKAKHLRAPPPALRTHANNARSETVLPQDRVYSTASSAKGALQNSRPQSRMASNLHRSQDELSRPFNAVLSTTSKTGSKRALGTEDGHVKGQVSRVGPANQSNDAKRRRTSAGYDDETETETALKIKGPPVRPSGGLKKDLPARPTYGYTSSSHGVQRDLFKATVTAQHHNQTKAAHPLDMAQISKGPIPFAPTSAGVGASHKTPARSGGLNAAKSTARSSPRFQNGDSIELPEIDTDDEDEDEDDAYGTRVAAWADSPDLRRALMRQETMDPSKIFGPAAPLNMEEVFSKSKHSFRARTSSANWSGADRLTEEEICRDREARDKLRRDGGWSYEMSREMI